MGRAGAALGWVLAVHRSVERHTRLIETLPDEYAAEGFRGMFYEDDEEE